LLRRVRKVSSLFDLRVTEKGGLDSINKDWHVRRKQKRKMVFEASALRATTRKTKELSLEVVPSGT